MRAANPTAHSGHGRRADLGCTACGHAYEAVASPGAHKTCRGVRRLVGSLRALTSVSPIFKAVREKRYKAVYTPARRSPIAPESALVRGSEPSNGDRLGGRSDPARPRRLSSASICASARLGDRNLKRHFSPALAGAPSPATSSGDPGGTRSWR
jgi:hypothetical protein